MWILGSQFYQGKRCKIPSLKLVEVIESDENSHHRSPTPLSETRREESFMLPIPVTILLWALVNSFVSWVFSLITRPQETSCKLTGRDSDFYGGGHGFSSHSWCLCFSQWE